ncbi:hypothetical protein ACFQ36_20145 [Arthrobacter sp. GCM10027362]|uniref:hypothetical protein n=1 Tax=Arthrobacter sp. GCM10027362 TaxID=3273379 RepID=UPI0036306657
MNGSWHEGVDPEVLEDIDILVGTALGMAQEQLLERGAFLPVALATTLEGELRLIAVSPDDLDEEPGEPEVDVDAMILHLYSVLKLEKADYRAIAVISDIFLPEEDTDAIQIAVEHSAGTAVSAIQPYSHDDEGNWHYPDPFLDPQERIVWPEGPA